MDMLGAQHWDYFWSTFRRKHMYSLNCGLVMCVGVRDRMGTDSIKGPDQTQQVSSLAKFGKRCSPLGMDLEVH